MDNIQDTDLTIDPGMVAAWNDDSDIDFNALRANLNTEESSAPEGDLPMEDAPEALEDEIFDDNLIPETDELEQPEDDDANTSEDSSAVEDVEQEAEQEPSNEDNSEPVDSTTQTFKVRANGMDFEFTAEELQKLAPKAMDYTKKMQEIAPYRKTISAMKENNVSVDDMNLMIDVLKGNKDAIAEVLKRTGIDALDIDTDKDTTFVPTNYGKTDTQLQIEEIVQNISRDPEYKITEQVVDYQWDAASRETLVANPQMIQGLHDDIKAGLYDKIAPQAFKMKAMDGGMKSDLEYYIEAASRYNESQRQLASSEQVQETVQKVESRQRDIQAMAPRRKAAAPSKAGTAGRQSVIDYLDDNDEAFEQWYKDTMSRV